MSEVTTKFLADLWGVDVRTVQNYADRNYTDNPLPRISRGKYDLLTAVKWMHHRQKRQIEILENSGDEKLHNLKLENWRIKNVKDQVALKMQLGKLVDKKGVLIAFSNQNTVIDSMITALENDLIRDLNLTPEQTKKLKDMFSAVKDLISKLEIEKYISNEEKLFEDEDEEET